VSPVGRARQDWWRWLATAGAPWTGVGVQHLLLVDEAARPDEHQVDGVPV
jgi:hypothetical protein